MGINNVGRTKLVFENFAVILPRFELLKFSFLARPISITNKETKIAGFGNLYFFDRSMPWSHQRSPAAEFPLTFAALRPFCGNSRPIDSPTGRLSPLAGTCKKGSSIGSFNPLVESRACSLLSYQEVFVRTSHRRSRPWRLRGTEPTQGRVVHSELQRNVS